jgi:hypothetical protein
MTSDTLITIQTEGYDAIVESYAVTPKSHQVCMLSIAGQPDAIKAIRATLSIGLAVTIRGVGSIQWPKQAETFFTFIHKRLASGAQAALWLPQLGTSVGIQHDTKAYIIERDYAGHTPPRNFIQILDRVLPCPMLEEWADPLWQVALQQKWVRPLETYNCAAWEFEPMTDPIIAWVQKHLQATAP